RLQPGGAEAIDGDARRRVWQAGAKRGNPRHVHTLFAFRHGATENHIFDVAICHLRISLEQRSDDRGGHVVRPDRAKRAAARFADGGTKTIDNNCFRHLKNPPLNSSEAFRSSTCTASAPASSGSHKDSGTPRAPGRGRIVHSPLARRSSYRP